MSIARMAISAGTLLVLASGVTAAEPMGLKHALDGERLGLLPGEQFRLANGKCTDCVTSKQALWYFQNEVVAVPKSTSPAGSALPAPGLVPLGAPQVFDGATLGADGVSVRAADGSNAAFSLTPKIASNLSYWDAKTTAYFAQRPVRMRGTYSEKDGKPSFVARTVWPKDFVIDQHKLVAQPFGAGEGLASFMRTANGGATSAHATRLLWERTPGKTRNWQDKPVLGFMLNGAQGDDDEAYGGHFGVTTGQMGKQGEYADWIVNNFYNLDSVSEKGIIAAPTPMDNYLMDLNSGQQYYRPSYMLVAVLSQPRTAQAYQSGVQGVFDRFYRHDFTYKHAAANCTGISMDVFKQLGWQIPERGPTSQLKAIGAYAYLSATEMSLASGRKIYDYLTEEQIRLYPAVAFDAAGNDLMQLVGAAPGARTGLSEYEKQLQSDVEALVLVRIPQIPSSRAMGSHPVMSFDEFMARAPADRTKWKIVPVGPRPFPAELRDANAVAEKTPGPVPLPIAGIAAAGVFGIGALIRRRKNRANKR